MGEACVFLNRTGLVFRPVFWALRIGRRRRGAPVPFIGSWRRIPIAVGMGLMRWTRTPPPVPLPQGVE